MLTKKITKLAYENFLMLNSDVPDFRNESDYDVPLITIDEHDVFLIYDREGWSLLSIYEKFYCGEDIPEEDLQYICDLELLYQEVKRDYEAYLKSRFLFHI